ncbi:hypothetical protein EJ03DRAFT_262915, partial [Teratosphaeria nubilosa]
TLLTSWPFFAVAYSIYGLAQLCLNSFQTSAEGISTSDSTASWSKRLRDPTWWMQLALPLYMLHQYEEYGLDIKFRHFYFNNTMCSKLACSPLSGFSNMDVCTIRPWHLTFINLGLVCFAALRCRYDAARAGANFYGLASANAFVHFIPAVIDSRGGREGYNPGLLSAIFLLLPCGWMALRSLYMRRVVTGFGVARAVILGVVGHLALFVGLYLRSRDKIGD